jgi:A/G-specific adenine glycosylase
MVTAIDTIRSGRYKLDEEKARIAFQRAVLEFYTQNGRPFPWRKTRDPYKILVSEVMLQQTQTSRVEQRYPMFLKQFPTLKALATAPQAEVLRAWQGLGYYRRARNLHRAAIEIHSAYRGRIPRSVDALRALPGIGAYTAAAVAVFAFDQAVPMIETNIRSVYLYTFFPGRNDVADKEILELITKTIVPNRAREWFYALMDLGVELKRAKPGINRASRHHAVQSPFRGSERELAAKVLRCLLARRRAVRLEQLSAQIGAEPQRVTRVVERLIREGMLTRTSSGLVRHS